MGKKMNWTKKTYAPFHKAVEAKSDFPILKDFSGFKLTKLGGKNFKLGFYSENF
jgi:hypothetical protein